MKKLILKITFLVLVICFSPFSLNSKDIVILKVYTFNRPPLYIVKNNKFSGILVEKTRKILDKAGINYKFISMPPSRILHTLQSDKNACSIGWLKTEKREKVFIFSKPIYSESDYFVIATRKNMKVGFKEALNNTHFAIALIKGFSYGKDLDEMLKNSKIKKFYIPNPDPEKLLLMIENNRVDFAVLCKEEGNFLLGKEDFKKTIKLIHIQKKIVIKRYIIFSKKTDKQIIDRINKAIEQLN